MPEKILKPEAWSDISPEKIKVHEEDGKKVVEFTEPIDTDSLARKKLRDASVKNNEMPGPSFSSERRSGRHQKRPDINHYRMNYEAK